MGDTKFRLEIESGNAAFVGYDKGEADSASRAEIARHLREVADRIERETGAEADGESVALFDFNGNRCGAWSLEIEPEDGEDDSPAFDPDDCGEVSGTYGAGRTPCTVYTYQTAKGTWYAVAGSLNLNMTWEDLEDGVDVESLEDLDTGTASAPIESAEDLAREVES